METPKKLISITIAAVLVVSAAFFFWPKSITNTKEAPPSFHIGVNKFKGSISSDTGLHAFTDTEVANFIPPIGALPAAKHELKQGFHFYSSSTALTIQQILELIEPTADNQVMIGNYSSATDNETAHKFSVWPKATGENIIDDPATYTIPAGQAFFIVSLKPGHVWKLQGETDQITNSFNIATVTNNWVLMALPSETDFQNLINQYKSKVESVWLQKAEGNDVDFAQADLSAIHYVGGYHIAWVRMMPAISISTQSAQKNTAVIGINLPKDKLADLQGVTVQYSDLNTTKQSLFIPYKNLNKKLNPAEVTNFESFIVENDNSFLISIENLAYDFNYTFEITAEYNNNLKSNTAIAKIKTDAEKEIQSPAIKIDKKEVMKNKVVLEITTSPKEIINTLKSISINYNDLKGSHEVKIEYKDPKTGKDLENGPIGDTKHTILIDEKNKMLSISLNELEYNNEYTFDVSAVSKNGTTISPLTVKITTAEKKTTTVQKLPKPNILKASRTVSIAQVTWTLLPSDLYKSDLKEYEFTYTDEVTSHIEKATVKIDGTSTNTNVEPVVTDSADSDSTIGNIQAFVKNLDPDNDYSFSIKAVNKDDIASDEATLLLKVGISSTGQNSINDLKAEPFSTGAKLTWTAPQGTSSYIIYYRLLDENKFHEVNQTLNCPNKTSPYTCELKTSSNQKIALVYGFSSKAKYIFKVKPNNKPEDSNESTIDVNPNAVDKDTTITKVTDLTGSPYSDGLKLEWTTTKNSTDYKVYYWSVETQKYEEAKVVVDTNDLPDSGIYTYVLKDILAQPGKKYAIVEGFDASAKNFDFIFQVKGNNDTDYSNQAAVTVKPKTTIATPQKIVWTYPVSGQTLDTAYKAFLWEDPNKTAKGLLQNDPGFNYQWKIVEGDYTGNPEGFVSAKAFSEAVDGYWHNTNLFNEPQGKSYCLSKDDYGDTWICSFFEVVTLGEYDQTKTYTAGVEVGNGTIGSGWQLTTFKVKN